MSKFLSEAFKKLELLEEEDFNLSADSGIEEMSLFMDDDEQDDSISIIDVETDSEDDLEDSYEGQAILDCPVCHSKIFKKIDLVKIDDEEELANVGEECPYCFSTGGFKVIGQVAPFVSDDSINVSIEDKDGDGEIEDDEIDVDIEESKDNKSKGKKSNKEPKKESFGRKSIKEDFDDGQDYTVEVGFASMIGVSNEYTVFATSVEEAKTDAIDTACEDLEVINVRDDGDGDYTVTVGFCGFIGVEEEFDVYADSEDEAEDEALEMAKEELEVIAIYDEDDNEIDMDESLKEDFEKVELETEDQKIKIETEPKETRETEEQIIPLSDTAEQEIMDNSEEPAFDEEEVDVDEFDEESFDELGESYLKEVYKNVHSFKTTSIKESKNFLKIEGNITFKSGNVKPTSFLFEQSQALKNNRIKLIGENLNITKGKKAFNIIGSVEGNKLVCESLNYNYRAKDEKGKSTRLYGTVKRR